MAGTRCRPFRCVSFRRSLPPSPGRAHGPLRHGAQRERVTNHVADQFLCRRQQAPRVLGGSASVDELAPRHW